MAAVVAYAPSDAQHDEAAPPSHWRAGRWCQVRRRSGSAGGVVEGDGDGVGEGVLSAVHWYRGACGSKSVTGRQLYVRPCGSVHVHPAGGCPGAPFVPSLPSWPAGPGGPAGPGTVESAPGGPAGPAGPGTVDAGPGDPEGPTAPVGPGGPGGPDGPGSPAAPGTPCTISRAGGADGSTWCACSCWRVVSRPADNLLITTACASCSRASRWFAASADRSAHIARAATASAKATPTAHRTVDGRGLRTVVVTWTPSRCSMP